MDQILRYLKIFVSATIFGCTSRDVGISCCDHSVEATGFFAVRCLEAA